MRERFDAFSAARPDHYLGPFLQAKGLQASLGPTRCSGKLAEAERLLLRSIELSPAAATPYYRLARVHSHLGETELSGQAMATHENLLAKRRGAYAGSDMQQPILSNELEPGP